MWKRSSISLSIVTLIMLTVALPVQGFDNFITRQDDKLYDGNREFRFISFNIPCLHYIEDDMQFANQMPFRLPDPFEIGDALETIKQMGGQVARTYTLPVRRKMDWDTRPVYVLGPGEFNEEAFRALDHCLALAHKHGIRLIIPFVNNFQWWGGVADYAAFRGKAREAFWTDRQCIEDFKQTVAFVINRTNTITGVPYKEDRTILAWETGNEIQCPHSWTAEICAYIKELDPKHLVVDGYYPPGAPLLREASLEDDNIDFVQTHHYEKDARKIMQNIKKNAVLARGKKPYHIGEFGFVSTEATRAVLDTVIAENVTGALIWSLRRHHRDGGFLWHHEPSGGDFFKAYHWPGFASGAVYDEADLMALMRAKAFEIQGVPVPDRVPPGAPVLLPIKDVGAISWRGSVGAASYRIERAGHAQGPWQCLAPNISDAQFQYRPLYCDANVEIGRSYFYRVIANNRAGHSQPSNVIQSAEVQHLTFVDELQNGAKTFHHSRDIVFKSNLARRFKEDSHRMAGPKGSTVLYHVPGEIKQIKVFSFSPEQAIDYRFAVSPDAQDFVRIDLKRTDTFSVAGNYGYWIPTLYQARQKIPVGTEYLKIQFQSTAQISRVEIAYRGKL
jgi:mannan endo-1,4-beta-mannosidase